MADSRQVVPLRVLTVSQPWASLIALGAKRVETRSWGTAYRGTVAIHAAKGFPADMRRDEVRTLAAMEPFRSALVAGGARCFDDLPRGAIVATATLTDIGQVPLAAGRWPERLRDRVTIDELAFGDLEPGRFGWLLDDVQQLATPVPARGALGLWRAPTDVAAAVAEVVRRGV